MFLFQSLLATDLSNGYVETNQQLTKSVLFSVNHPNHLWVDAVAPRVVHNIGGGSGAIIGINSKGLAVVFSAQHVFMDWPQNLKDGIKARLYMQGSQLSGDGFFRAYYGSEPGFAHPNLVNVGYRLYLPAVALGNLDPKNTSGGGLLGNIPPSADFAILLLSGRKVAPNEFLQTVVTDPISLPHSPHGILRQRDRIALPQNGQMALAIGFPIENARQQSYTIAQIVTGEKAKSLYNGMKNEDLNNAKVLFNPDIEFLMMGKASSGMSGGGVFDISGRYLGVMVRGGIFINGQYYIRVVKAQWILEHLKQMSSELPQEQRLEFDSLIQ